jgi:CHAD domain-containing protein
VASRRLRELLPVLELPASAVAKLTRRLRKVTSRLGTIRELDVLNLLLEDLQGSGRHDPGAVGKVAHRVSRERARRRDRLEKRLPIAGLRRVARKIERLVGDIKQADSEDRAGKSERAWRWAVDARVARRATSLVESVRLAGALYLPERLHAVRIGVKKLRYALELSSDIAGTKRNPDLATLKRVQDLLGRMHDLQMLVDRVRQTQASIAPPDLATWRHLDTLTTTLENRTRRLHARYVHERPAIESMCQRLGTGQQTGRRKSVERRQAG